MFSALAGILEDVFGGVRLADIIDVIVVSVFTYAVIAWVRRARSRFVLLGFATLVALYFVARLLDMYLTLFLFQAGITVALLALVVIFQEEIRRAFERIATSGLLRAGRAPAETPSGSLDLIIEAASSLARARTGALIVLRGKEPLERHTSGGISLDGALSEALLFSIFDPSSAGHDGAVIIEKGRLTRFAVHLPLSTRVKDGARFGTRHTAALGLSERSDALVIAVSEERGVMSVARAGVLEETNASELKGRLLDFMSEVVPARRMSVWQRLFARDLGTKALAVALAILAWLLVFGQQRETVARTYDVPVVYRAVPDGWLLDDPDPPLARVTISGKSRSFELVTPTRLRLSVDASSIEAGRQTVNLTPRALGLPSGLTVHEIEPESVTFRAYRLSPKELPVRAELSGRLPSNLVLQNVEVSPDRIRLMVRSSTAERTQALRTEPIDLSAITASSSLTRGIVVPHGSRLARGEPTEVQVQVTVTPKP
ncbi:MAG TPA: diadenylate cyclase [Polyangiaceae bacterium]|nr:diadenylate cyclase [Polyangiaceae bacterium]